MAARRSQRPDQTASFGSDSFLDIVANIVGILIILIVIVGVRVKNAPVTETPSDAELQTKATLEAQQAERERLLQEHESALKQRQDEIQAAEQENQRRLREYRQALADRERLQQQRGELLARQDQARAELAVRRQQRQNEIDARLEKQRQIDRTAEQEQQALAKLQQELAELDSLVQGRLQEKQQLQRELEQAQTKLTASSQQVQAALAKRDLQTEKWETLRQKLLQTQNELEQVDAIPKPVTKWVHHPSARGEYSNKQRIFLRCKNGKIAYTYETELAAQAIRKSDNQLSMEHRTATGVAGPIGGFTMHYRIASRVLGDSVAAQFLTRQLESFSLHGESDDLGETPERIAQPGSRLQAVLLQRPPSKYIIACWVYPDSFRAAKALSTFLNEQGYSVSMLPITKTANMEVGPSGLRTITQ